MVRPAVRSATWRISFDRRAMPPDLRRNLPAIIYATAEVMREEWVRAARRSLSSTARVYVEGIGPIVQSNRGMRATIKLTGWLPNKVEEGGSPFDMKPGLLHGDNAKRSVGGGLYNTVPFGHTTPGTNPTTAMPVPIYKLAKNMQQDQRLRLGGTKLEGYGQRSKLTPDPNKWGNYTWKTSPYEGMIRQRTFAGMPRTTVAGRLHNYKTFRRVSTKSDPNSWVHPGFRPRNLMEQAVAATERRFGEIAENMVLA